MFQGNITVYLKGQKTPRDQMYENVSIEAIWNCKERPNSTSRLQSERSSGNGSSGSPSMLTLVLEVTIETLLCSCIDAELLGEIEVRT